MMHPSAFESGVTPLKLEAIDWAARLAIGPVSDEDWHAFERWRRSSPAHDDAFRVASEFMGDLRVLDLAAPAAAAAADNVVALHPRGPLSRRAFMSGGAVAATVAAGIVATQSPLGLWPSLAELMADERTGAGQRIAFSPLAGVDVELSSRSSVSRIDRGLRLVTGEIFVSVGRLPQTFSVEAAGGSFAASAARFNIRAFDAELCVTCIEGNVAARHGGAALALARGDAVGLAVDGTLCGMAADPAIATAWRRGLLIFEGTPLKSAISQINRYYPGRLVLNGGNLGTRPITGVFHTDQIQLAVIQLRNLTGVAATHLPGGVVVLS